jgi:hypothetical protein
MMQNHTAPRLSKQLARLAAVATSVRSHPTPDLLRIEAFGEDSAAGGIAAGEMVAHCPPGLFADAWHSGCRLWLDAGAEIYRAPIAVKLILP